MKKKTKSINIRVNGSSVTLTRDDKGYYLGKILVTNVPFHIEAIEVKVKTWKIDRGLVYQGIGVSVSAKNIDFQNRIENWQGMNEGMTPNVIEVKGVKYFVNIEAYAA